MSDVTGDVFRWPCSVWIHSQKRWAYCKMYLFENRLTVCLVKEWNADPEVPAVYIQIDLCMLLDARLSRTWTGYRSLILVSNAPGEASSGGRGWRGLGASECLSGNELWLSYVSSASSALNAIQLFRRSSLLEYCHKAKEASNRSPNVSLPPGASVAEQTDRILSMAEDSERTLAQAAVELDSQRQSLETSHATVKGINEQLKVASRLLSQTTSHFPAMTSSPGGTPRGRDVHSAGAKTHCIVYSVEGSDRMFPGTIGLFQPDGRGGKVDLVLRGKSGNVIDESDVMLVPITDQHVNLITTKDGKQTRYGLCCPKVSDIFHIEPPAATNSTSSSSGPPAAAAAATGGASQQVLAAPTGAGTATDTLASVSQSLQRMKVMALNVGEELQDQNSLLEGMHADVDKATMVVQSLTNKAARAV